MKRAAEAARLVSSEVERSGWENLTSIGYISSVFRRVFGYVSVDGGVFAHHRPQIGDIALEQRARFPFVVHDVADAHHVFRLEGDRGDPRVHLLGKDACRNGVAAVVGEQVGEGASVGDADVLSVGQIGEGFFGVIKGVRGPLLEGVTRERLEVGRLHHGLARKGMVFADEHVNACVEEGMEGDVRVFEGLGEDASVEIIGEEDPRFASKRSNVVDDLARCAFAKDEIVPASRKRVGGLHEGLHAEGVMLGRDGQARMVGVAFGVTLFKHVGLLDDLPRVTEQLRAVVGERDAAVASREYGDSQLALELLDRRRQVGLRCIEVVRRRVYGAVFGDGDEIAQLLQGHMGVAFRNRLAANTLKSVFVKC